MKKLLSYLLVIALVLVQVLPVVNAAETTGSITITTDANQTAEGPITYNIYKMFDLSLNEDGTAYRYTIDETSDWYDFLDGEDAFVLTQSVGTEYVVTMPNQTSNSDEMAALAKAALAYAELNGIQADKTATIAQKGTSTTVSGLSLGYYLIDSSIGTLVALTSTDREAEVIEKNTVPTIDKTVNEGGTYGSTSNGQIGDTVEYKVVINAKNGAQNYVLKDTMTEGLTFNEDSIKVTVGTKTLVKGEDYTVAVPGEEGETFVITFADEYLDTITEDTEIIVTYSAVINEKAVINGTGNVNETELEYGDDNKTAVDYTRTYVLAFELVKTDADNNELSGAKFKLYRTKDSETAIKFVVATEEGTTYYRVATKEEIETVTIVEEIEVGTIYIKGLDEGTYYLEETVAPEGYNKLTERIAVSLEDVEESENSLTHITKLTNETTTTVKYNADQVTVINTTGSILPSTGGMGTVLFVTIGSIMVLGFGVLLVTKLRLSKMVI